MKKLNKSQKGITLIALVITIIVLIILAGVSISMLTGESGLIQKAKMGAQNFQNAAAEERSMLDDLLSDDGDDDDDDDGDKGGEIDLAAQTNIAKDTSNVTWDPAKSGGKAQLDLGEVVNLLMKKTAALANGVSEATVNTWTVYDHEDTYITSIVWSNTEPTAAQKKAYGQIAMTAGSELGRYKDGTTNKLIVSDVPIYIWYDAGTIYMWSSNSTITMHPHSERMFQGMKNLTNISALSHFVADDAESVRFMFKDTKITNFSVCNNWNVTNVKSNENSELENDNGFYHMCNGTPSNSHPTFSKRAGAWNNEGTFLDTSTASRILADVNMDGVINEDDYQMIVDFLQKILASLPQRTDGLFSGDVNMDGRVSMHDAVAIQSFYQ